MNYVDRLFLGPLREQLGRGRDDEEGPMSEHESAERFTNQKRRIATERDVAARWGGGGFGCGMCGVRFKVGDGWRWQYANTGDRDETELCITTY